MFEYEISSKLNEIKEFGTIKEFGGYEENPSVDVTNLDHDALVALCVKRLTDPVFPLTDWAISVVPSDCHLRVNIGEVDHWIAISRDIKGKIQALPLSKISWFKNTNQ
jgi:hypothetical protein